MIIYSRYNALLALILLFHLGAIVIDHKFTVLEMVSPCKAEDQAPTVLPVCFRILYLYNSYLNCR